MEHSPKLPKQCVFCGRPPTGKNKEHVVPQWLIKMTGDPSRKAFFGLNWQSAGSGDATSSPPPAFREFAFKSFTFPACESCNSRYSHLELKAKRIVTALLESKPVAECDFDILLDWLDKVRVGIWLGMLFLNGSASGIVPKIHIDTRVRRQDRMVAIYRTKDSGPGINLLGVQGPAFEAMPSAFAIQIQDICLLNISTDQLFSKCLGFPYTEFYFSSLRKREKKGKTFKGTEVLTLPGKLAKFIPPGSINLYQPLFPDMLKNEGTKGFYDNEYVARNSISQSGGIGGIFAGGEERISRYPSAPSMEWSPPEKVPLTCSFTDVALAAIDVQAYLLENHTSTDLLPENEKRVYERQCKLSREGSEAIKQIVKERAQNQPS